MKISKILEWTGLVIAGISSAIYLVIVFILINGFQSSVASDKLLVFLALGALDGILVSSAMRLQGVTFARNLPQSQEQLKVYNDLRGNSKKVKIKPITYTFITGFLIDVIFKGGSILFTMYFTISIMIEGMKDQSYFLLAIANVLMFFGLGMMALAKGYSKYLDDHIPYLTQKINLLKEEKVSEQISRVEIERAEAIRTSNGSRVHPDIAEPIRFDNGSGNGTASEPGQGSEVEDRLHQPGEVISGV